MKQKNRFLLDVLYEKFFRSAGIDVDAALLRAGLPRDSFRRKGSVMTQRQYFDFLNAIAFLLGYHETNPFLHAFVIWPNMTIGEYGGYLSQRTRRKLTLDTKKRRNGISHPVPPLVHMPFV